MKRLVFPNTAGILFMALLLLLPTPHAFGGIQPIADAGLSRYGAKDPIILDGTGSYDPDNSGTLSYAWRQVAGPSLVISGANTPNPTVSGFVQTDQIQICDFELVVNDGELTSMPDTVEVVIVPDFGESILTLENDSFDNNKPTIIYFGGGDGVNGLPIYAEPPWNAYIWNSRANIISFPEGYTADENPIGWYTYHRCADMIIVYLSSVAPNYIQPIHTIGWSTGGAPSVDVASYLNLTYQDARYAVNRVTGLDAADASSSDRASQFLSSSVDGEQCWLDIYLSIFTSFVNNVLGVAFEVSDHSLPPNWYGNSLTNPDANGFNDGVVAGAYWSVIGSGKNLQLASTPGVLTYKFKWYGSASSGYMDFYSEAVFPGRLPGPVKLIEPNYVKEAGGYILTCEESQNAVGYELLSGSNPHRVMDYQVISDTPAPPNEVITTLPFEDTWWTVRVRDQYGSTIYADPEYINPALDMVDFDRNGKVDSRDYSILSQYWRQNESLVDIAPIPGGDGIVDFNDLRILVGSWLIVAKIPPGQTAGPNPPSDATGVDPNADLSWTAGYAATSYDLYFGTSSPPPFIHNQSTTTLEPGTMYHSSTYYWRIDAVNASGKTTGPVWSFTTGDPLPP